MKILFLSRWFPYPTNNGSKLRIYNLLRVLGKHHDVTLLSFADEPDVSPDVSKVQAFCSEVQVVPWREFDPHSLRARFGFLSLTPRSIVDTFSLEMAKKIGQILNTRKFDIVIASQLSMAAYRPYFKDIPALFEEIEIGLSYGWAHHPQDLKRQARHIFTWLKLRLYLSRLLGSFQACTVVSVQERHLLAREFSGSISTIEVIPNCLQISEYENVQPVLKPRQLIFSGSFRYQANYEAMLWFVREVYPLILKQIPDVQLVITGDHADLPLPSTSGVVLTGYVEDIKTLIASSCVSIAPLLSGGGTRLKILEAMALGTPVVSTSKGAEGLEAVPDEHLLLADFPDAFANEVVRVINNKSLRTQLSVNGKQFVKLNYSWDSVFPRFLCLLEGITG